MPGNTKVTLNDPTLAVSSGGSEIEVVSGRPQATRNTAEAIRRPESKYRGDVRTTLGKPVPGDRTLQVVSDGEIFYAYSENFRAKVTVGENVVGRSSSHRMRC